MGATGRPQSHAWISMGVVEGPDHKNDKLFHGLSTWKGWYHPGGSVALEEGQIGLVFSVPIP